MPCFPRLLAVEKYRPAIFDLIAHPSARKYWIDIFRLNVLDIERIVHENRDGTESRRVGEARQEFFDFLARMSAAPDAAYPDVHTWSIERDRVLKEHLIPDPYLEVKERENRIALSFLSAVFEGIERIGEPYLRLRETLLHIFAGNMFDLGSAVTAKAHRERGLDFAKLLDGLRDRLWFIDHLDRFFEWLAGPGAHTGRHVLFLADNAGPDFLCGCIPFALELVSHGCRVTIGLNEKPALNDVTFEEGTRLLAEVSALHPRCRRATSAGALRLMSTGSFTAGIDLRDVSKEMCRFAESIDLLILEGQGRAVETNWNSRFDVDCVRISTIKDAEVARYLGAKVYDVLFRFTEFEAPFPRPG